MEKNTWEIMIMTINRVMVYVIGRTEDNIKDNG